MMHEQSDHMEVGDTDENATSGKEVKQEQLSAPATTAESLSSRRAGESSFFSRRFLGGSPEASSNGSMNTALQNQAVFTGSLPTSPPQASLDGQASPQGQVVRSEITTPESQRFSYEALVQLGAEETPVHAKSFGEDLEEVDNLFVPDDDQDWMKPKRPPPADMTGPAKQMTGPMLPETERAAHLEAGNEEAEWLERKRVTGVIGRMVQYAKGDMPAKDVIGLHRSGRGRLMVTAVRGDGPAARAGVVAGDQLVSINGEKIWEYCPAKAVLNGVKGPVTLVFLGFSGKLQAEVRVKQPDEPRLGLPPQISVPNKVVAKTKREEDKKKRAEVGQMQSATSARGYSSFNPSAVELSLQDTVVFEHKPAYSMFIATEEADASVAQNDSKPKTPKQAAASSSRAGSGVYELLQEDARDILARALKGEIV
eukprot:TRINITY_DN10193_c0_g1_i1.p1 TRINITY_DN10193_c0_g1~~TRINITY_DN10193_c0_g1_i1.p1  ORF type:complete len:425 (-),score=103.68 TRINITY_DN10193_c0_g1_i1:119-1393(-)